MGQRHNAQDLDLNRDNTKMETSEARSVARLLRSYDPHIAIDLHTTDGSAHGLFLMLRTRRSARTRRRHRRRSCGKTCCRWVTKTVKAKHGWDYFYYGGVYGQGERAWRGDLDLYKPRYMADLLGAPQPHRRASATYRYASFKDSDQGRLLVRRGDHQLRGQRTARPSASHRRRRRRLDRRQRRPSQPTREVPRPGAYRFWPTSPTSATRMCPIGRRAAASTAPSVSRRCPLRLHRADGDRVVVPPLCHPRAPRVGRAAATPPVPPPGPVPGRARRLPGPREQPPFMGGPSGPPAARMWRGDRSSPSPRCDVLEDDEGPAPSGGAASRSPRRRSPSSEYQGTHKLRTLTGEWETVE